MNLYSESGNDVYIVSLGASTPVGRDAWSSAAAVRAGISGFTEHPYMIDTAGEPMRVAIARWLDLDCTGVRRVESLLFPAIEQAMTALDGRWSGRGVGLAVALPASRPGLPPELEPAIRTAITSKFRDCFTRIATFPIGHAGGFFAMRAACEGIQDGSFDAFIVAGVDSYLEAETLEWLEANDQLHGGGPLNNAWGFIPGEGAGAVLLTSAETARRQAVRSLAKVLSIGDGFERNRIKTKTICIGEGLTAAFREGLEGLWPGTKVTDIYCDMNGEPYRADEFGFACLRTKESFQSVSDFIAPADCWGDVSAASAPLSIVLSTIAVRKAYANGPLAFLWAGSESGQRGAALLRCVID